MADITTSLLPAMTNATSQEKIFWTVQGPGYRCQVLHWQVYIVRTGDIVSFQIIDDVGRAVALQDIDSVGARALHTAVETQIAANIAADEVSLTQFIGILGSF